MTAFRWNSVQTCCLVHLSDVHLLHSGFFQPNYYQGYNNGWGTYNNNNSARLSLCFSFAAELLSF